MNNINISKDLEKSIVPDSIIITDANNKPKYLTPPNYPEMYLGKDTDGTIKYKSITFPQAQVNNDLGYFGSTIQQGFPLVKDTSTNLSGFRRDFFGDGIFSIGLNQNTPQFGLYDGLFYSPLLRYYSNRFNIGNFGTTVGSAQQHEILVSNQGVDNTTIPALSNNYSINLMSSNTMGASNIMSATHRLFGVDNNYYGGGVGTGAKSSISNVQTALFRHTINTGANIDFGTVSNIRSQLYRRTGGSTINTFYHINTEDVDTAVPITNYFGLHILAGDKNYIKNNLGINTLTPARKLEITETAGTPPIRTTNMTSSSTDMTGTVKTVVVDANGDFGVKTINDISNVNRPFSKIGSGQSTNSTNVSLTDNIYHNGRVVIGNTTDDGSNLLQVNGNSKFGANSWLSLIDSGSGNGRFTVTSTGSFDFGGHFLFRNLTGSTEFLRVTNIGYVGIGVNPVKLFHVHASNGTHGNSRFSNSGSNGSVTEYIDNSNNIIGVGSVNGAAWIGTSGTGFIRILSSGALVLGNVWSDTGHILQANGNGYISGTFGIGTSTINSSSVLDLTSTTKGFLPPRMTTAQRTAITSPAEGLEVYDLDLHKKMVWDGTVWQACW